MSQPKVISPINKKKHTNSIYLISRSYKLNYTYDLNKIYIEQSLEISNYSTDEILFNYVYCIHKQKACRIKKYNYYYSCILEEFVV